MLLTVLLVCIGECTALQNLNLGAAPRSRGVLAVASFLLADAGDLHATSVVTTAWQGTPFELFNAWIDDFISLVDTVCSIQLKQ